MSKGSEGTGRRLAEMKVLLEQDPVGNTPGIRVSRVLVDESVVVLRMTLFNQNGGINLLMNDDLVGKLQGCLKKHEEIQEERRALLNEAHKGFRDVGVAEHRPINRR